MTFIPQLHGNEAKLCVSCPKNPRKFLSPNAITLTDIQPDHPGQCSSGALVRRAADKMAGGSWLPDLPGMLIILEVTGQLGSRRDGVASMPTTPLVICLHEGAPPKMNYLILIPRFV